MGFAWLVIAPAEPVHTLRASAGNAGPPIGAAQPEVTS